MATLPVLLTPAEIAALKITQAQSEFSWSDNRYKFEIYKAQVYNEASIEGNLARNVIAGIQAATQILFANKEYEVKKQAQDRLDNISTIELARSGELFAQFQKGIETEDIQLADAKAQLAALPTPDYDAIKNRVLASVNSQFTRAKTKVMECYPPHCQAAACAEIAKLEMEQAKTASAQIEAAWRKEHVLYETRKATLQAHLLQILNFGRGGLNQASALLQGAAQSTLQSANMNPYAGFQRSINNIAETGRSISTQNGLQQAMSRSNMRAMQAPSSIGSGVEMDRWGIDQADRDTQGLGGSSINLQSDGNVGSLGNSQTQSQYYGDETLDAMFDGDGVASGEH
jgi:hypothetical protein